MMILGGIGEAMVIGGSIAAAGTIVKMWHDNKDQRFILKRWYKTMDGANLKNHMDETYTIKEISKEKYGYECIVKVPAGKAYEDLLKINDVLDTTYAGIVDIRKGRFQREVAVTIIQNEFADVKFAPVEVKSPKELYVGTDYKNEPIIVDMEIFPHVLIGGVTGSGKSRCVFIILSNLVHNFGKADVELYLTQIAKRDLSHFKDTENCIAYAKTPAQAVKMFKMLEEKREARDKLFEKYGVDDVYEFNAKYPKRKLPLCYVTSDEISLYMPDKTDSKEVAKMKNQCLDYLKRLIKLGRSAGVLVIMATQKTSTDNLPSTIKTQTNCKITYRQTTTQSSINIIEDTKAVGLPKREAIVYTDDYIYMKTPFIDKELMYKYIHHRIQDDHENMELDKLKDAADSQPDIQGTEKDTQPVHNVEEIEDNNDVNNLGFLDE